MAAKHPPKQTVAAKHPHVPRTVAKHPPNDNILSGEASARASTKQHRASTKQHSRGAKASARRQQSKQPRRLWQFKAKTGVKEIKAKTGVKENLSHEELTMTTTTQLLSSVNFQDDASKEGNDTNMSPSSPDRHGRSFHPGSSQEQEGRREEE